MKKILSILLLFLLNSVLYAEPVVSVKTEYYTVKGLTPDAIRKNMNKHRPGKYDAYTNWHVRWKFYTEKDGKYCEISEVEVTLDVKFVLPRWKSRREAEDDVKEQWDDYYDALIEHENQHKDIAIEAAKEIENALNDLDAEKSCGHLEKTANDTAYEVLEEYKAEQKEFDEDTNHGIDEGAVFP